MEQVLRVVLVLQSLKARVLLRPEGGAHPVLVVLIGEVQVDAVRGVRLHRLGELLAPGDVRVGRLLSGVHPHREGVVAPGHIPAPESRLVLAHLGDCSAERLEQELHHRAGTLGPVLHEGGDRVVAHLAEELRLEVGADAVGAAAVEHALQRDVGHLAHHVHTGLRDLADRCDHALALLLRARPADHDADQRLEVHLLRDERLGRGAYERHPGAEVGRRVGHVVAHEGEDLRRAVGRAAEQPAVDHRADLVQLQLELGDHAEVAAAAADAPEEVRVLVLAGADHAAIGGDHLGRQEVVTREAALALEPAAAAAEHQAGDPGGGEAAAGDGEAVHLRRAVELAPGETGLGAAGLGVGVDIDALHQREVDNEAVVDRAVTGGGVPAGAHGDRQAVVAAVVHGGHHVSGGRAARDQRRMSVEEAVPDDSCFVVSGVTGP